jgi:hypothetical protein
MTDIWHHHFHHRNVLPPFSQKKNETLADGVWHFPAVTLLMIEVLFFPTAK